MSRSWLRATAICGALSATLLGGVTALAPAPRLIWNASPSVPVGLYSVDVASTPGLGDLLVIDPPERVAALLAARGYLPRGLPLLKHVAALEGALVCRSGVFVTIDGVAAVRALTRDRAGRPLPVWLGCRRLQRGEVFILNAAPSSLDSRYFGPLRIAASNGIAHPLLTRRRPDAPLRWRSGAAPFLLNQPEKDQAR